MAAEAVAEKLGVQTRLLVAARHVETARDWALQMASENSRQSDPRRATSYFELAVVLGHHEPAVDDLASRKWRELAEEAQRLWTATRVKADEEAAKEAAKARAEAAAKATAKVAKERDETPAA